MLGGCAGCRCPTDETVADEPAPRLDLTPVAFGSLEGWQQDDPSPALEAFRRSCEGLLQQPDQASVGPDPRLGEVVQWRAACEDALWLGGALDAASARAFFESWFTPYQISSRGDEQGLFTGYYEPQLHGSTRPGGRYTVPLRAVPTDLVRVELGRFDPDLAGRWIAGRVENGGFVPYYPRSAIEEGALSGRQLELLWVDDPIDKFFLQIQGSGRVVLDDGRVVRVGYASQNGHPYRAIGRDLIEIGALERDEVSLQSIRTWLRQHPDQADAIMDRNRAYVFFEERPGLGPDDGPIGAEGVPLTPGRSLAVDRSWLPLGAPLWLETTVPDPAGARPFNRLMIAQDTGGAIDGVVRGDVFFGWGEHAEWLAGQMQNEGRYAVLLPRSLAPTS